MKPKHQFPDLAAMVNIPWFFDRFRDKHLIMRSGSKSFAQASHTMTSIVGRVLVSFPPGLVRFLFVDPVGLGKNFASFHTLADYDDKIISNRVWSDRRHIRDELGKIVEHIENVVQKYLRADYESIDDYNTAAEQIAEPYRFVVINGFPEGFDSEACLSLERIIANGPKCGVHVVMLWDTGKQLPHGVKEQQIVQDVNVLNFAEDTGLSYANSTELQSRTQHFIDEVPSESALSKIVDEHGKNAAEGARVEVPFDQLMEKVTSSGPAGLEGFKGTWSLDNGKNLMIPVGPTGARKVQYLTLGEKGSTAHHALLIGKTGSGKSNLLHVMIVAMAELYSPEDLELYLVDFKQGVEFKDYAELSLPHARVIAIESEIEFGISVLRGLDAELARRGELFREAGTAELESYRRSTGEKLPRTVMIIDEFHELLNEDGPLSREAVGIMDRMVRQGRSFGMHLILASQSLAGVRLPKSILEQIGVRIAMQCSDADSRLVLAEDNPVARLLDRAGEAIYNDKNGRLEGNNTFQVALLKQEDRLQRLEQLRSHALEVAEKRKLPFKETFVFEGNLPANFENCAPLRAAVSENNSVKGTGLELWIGEPIAMRPPHAVQFKRQSGAHLLVVNRDEKLGFGVTYSCVLSALAQRRPSDMRIEFIDLSSADQPWADYPEEIEATVPSSCKVYGRKEMPNVIHELAESVKNSTVPNSTTFLVIFGLQRARDMRRESGSLGFGRASEEPTIHDNLATILREGPDEGVHVLVWCDTLQNFTRSMDNSALAEFGHRVVGGLSANDSMKLLDDPIASKIKKDNRVIVHDDEKVGVYEHIRPYLPPEEAWLKEYLEKVSDRGLKGME